MMLGRVSRSVRGVVPARMGRMGVSRSIFINTESTPNPNSLKFLPNGEEVLREEFGTGMFFQKNSIKDINRSPLAKGIFAVGGVKAVFFGRDFITITKDAGESWPYLKSTLFEVILDFYGSGKAVIEENEGVSDTAILDTDDEVVATIKELIETRVRPSVQEDGGDIFYEGFNPGNGIVSVRLAGSCVGCPSSSITLRNGVENMLMHYVPEVKGIEEVGALEEEEEQSGEKGSTTLETMTGQGLSP